MMYPAFDESTFGGTREAEHGELNTVRLHRFLEDQLDATLPPLHVERFRGGQSNPTYKVSAGQQRFVLRSKPNGKAVAAGHAIDREFRIMSALANTRVPVPRTLTYCANDSALALRSV